MIKNLVKRKYNPYLIGRNNYFPYGGAVTPDGTVVTLDLGIDANPDSLYGKLLNKVKLLMPPTNNNYGGIASFAGGVATDIAGLINNIQSNDITNNADLRINTINAAQLDLQNMGDSFDNLTQDIANSSELRHITAKDLGSNSFGKSFGNALSSGIKGATAGAALGPIGSAIGGGIGAITSAIGNIFRGNKAEKEAKRVNAAIDYTNNFNNRSFINRADNLMNNQIANLNASYAAFGGELNTQGGDFTNGLISINNGGYHETNPNEGVPIGVDPEGMPNLVEEGETIYNNYVFSNRLKVPKAIRSKYKIRGNKNLTFADMSKIMAKESEERPNNPISLKGLEAMLKDLAKALEEVRGNSSNNLYATGGNLYPGGTENLLTSNNYLNPFVVYDWVNGYNNNWYDTEGNYTADYLNKVNAMTDDDINRAFNSQYAFYIDPNVDKNSKRYKAIKEFYDNNPAFMIPDVTGRLSPQHYTLARALARDKKPGFMHMIFGEAPAPAKRETRYWAVDPITGKASLMELNNPNYIYPYEGVAGPDSEYNGYAYNDIPNNPWKYRNEIVRDYDAGTGTIFTDKYYIKNVPAEEIKNGPSEDAPDLTMEDLGGKSWEGWRFAPMIGLGIMSLTDVLGLTNRPDYSNANALLEASSGAGTYQPVKFNPIGNYLTYTPIDRDRMINNLNAQAGATRRGLLNTAGGNRATAMAGLLAADNTYLNQIGDAIIKAEADNFARRKEVEDFNRNTNITNALGALLADTSNQDALIKAKDFKLRGTAEAMGIREKARLASEANRAANLAGLFESIGNIGEENKNMNMLKFLVATGAITAPEDLLNYVGVNVKRKPKETKTGEQNKKSKGGIIKRKKGLTI